MITSRAKELLIVLLFIGVASASFFFTRTLASVTPEDEYSILMANEAVKDSAYPNRDVILFYNFGAYAYNHEINYLTENFDIESYRSFLLFLYVFLTAYGCYLALRLVGISRVSSLTTSIIALVPRLALGSTFFGVFTNAENVARSGAFFLIWLLAAWHFVRLRDGATLWPVLLVAGLTSYFHPVTMLLFAVLFVLVTLFYRAWEGDWMGGLKQAFTGGIAFSLGACALLFEVFSRTKTIASGYVSGIDYGSALRLRVGWEFPQYNITWLKAIFIINLFFFVFIVAARYISRGDERYKKFVSSPLVRWSILVAVFSVALSIIVPAAQLYAVEHFDAPLLVQQTSRIFIFAYLALFAVFAATLDYLWTVKWLHKKWRHVVLAFILIFGLLSSSIGVEWLKVAVGFRDYLEGLYVPLAYRPGVVSKSDFETYPVICNVLHAVGATRNTLVIANDVRVRYFCKVPLYITWKDGGAYLNAGKRALVDWRDKFVAERDAIDSEDLATFLTFAKSAGGKFAVLPSSSPIVSAAQASGLLVQIVENRAIIVLK